MSRKIKTVPGSRVYIPKYNLGGRPTKYDDDVLIKTLEYIQNCDQFNEIPYIQELGLILGVDDETILEWAKKRNEDGSLAYPQFSATIKTIKKMQELKLLRSSMSSQSTTGSIFQLKTNHGYIETEKKIIDASVKNDDVRSLTDLTKQRLELLRGSDTPNQ